MNFRTLPFFFTALIVLISLAITAPLKAETINYTPDPSVILNPERGLAKLIGNIGSSDSIIAISELRGDNHTIAWGTIWLGSFRNDAVLSAGKINEIKGWLDAARAHKVKTILRIVYHEVENFTPPAASLAIQESHLEQLGTEIFVPYNDVIIAFQAGGIGAYGEWYYTPADFTLATSRRQLLDKMFDVIPDNAFVMVRTPYYKQEYEVAGGGGDRVYRTAHYNDCFLSDDNDIGTYLCYPYSENCPEVSSLQSYVANDSNVVPVGGETCNSTPLNDCAEALAGMEFYGYSFINTLWHSSIRSKWETQGCFDTIAKKLGYHYELVSAVVPDTITPNSEFTVAVTVKNTGWAPMYHARPVYIRMMDEQGGELLYYWTGVDSRDWLAGGQEYTFSNTFIAPVSINTSTVSLSIWMPDSLPANYAVSEYAVHFANQGVWDENTGNNILKANISVSDSAPTANVLAALIALLLFK